MRSGYGSFVILYTAVSVGGIAWQIHSAFKKVLPGGFSIALRVVDSGEAAKVLQAILQSSFTIGLLANLLLNFFVLVALFMKTIFFGTLSLLETQKVVERLLNYVLFKGLFLTWVVQPEMMHVALWLGWFAVLGFLKMFQGLARDRLERLNASPTATVLAHLRVFSVLLLVLVSDLFWIHLCLMIFKDTGISTFMLLLFEPLSIASDTLQAALVHGMQIADTWRRQQLDAASTTMGLHPIDRSVAGAAWEWRAMVVRNFSFVMDIVSLLLALGHCLHIWWLRGLAFQVVDAILFLNLRALLSAILKRIKGFMRMQTAMSTLQGALPDAMPDELASYDDDCAICKEPMAKAKRLPCAHLFHLPCLRSWLDQGLAETYSCPTCRRPLFMGNPRAIPSTSRVHAFSDSHRGIIGLTSELDRLAQSQPSLINTTSYQGSEVHYTTSGQSLEDHWNTAATDTWGGPRTESEWVHALPGGGSDGDALGTSSRGLSPIQSMMRHITGARRGHGTSISSGSLRWWPFGSHTVHNSSVEATNSTRRRPDASGPRRRMSAMTATHGNEPGSTQMQLMAGIVREVLPHVPEEVIVQDLRRTNCATATVNNLL